PAGLPAMIMTPIAPDQIEPILAGFAARLAATPRAAAAFARIAATWPVAPGSVDTPAQRADAVRLAGAFGIDAWKVADMDGFRTALDAALAERRPALIECAIDMDETVLPMVPSGKPIEELVLEAGD
ncbi:MAG: hypothetical protein WCL50_05575, partial [Spirochaetota bacterium]